MFELYKKRELGDCIADTFGFFKHFGKHFFKIFFVINGGFLLLTGALIYWFISMQDLSAGNLQSNNPNTVFNTSNGNFPLFIGLLIVLMIVVIVLSLFNAAYPIIYLKLIEQNKTKNFSIEEVIKAFKQNAWKIIKFSTGMIFIVVPVLMIAIVLMFLLCFIVVGIPLLIISLPAFFTLVNLSFYSYLTEDKGFFESFNHAYALLKQNFWNTIGTTFLMMLMVQMVQASVTMVMYFFVFFVFLISAVGNSNFETAPFEGSPFFIAIVSLLFVFIFALSYILNNLLMINQGIIYYSLEADEKTSTRDIELIGTDNE
jgi:hypothetical protein